MSDAEHPPTPCPFLPVPERPITARDSKALGDDRGEDFYRLCLEYAQTKWLSRLPAQALLQLNRAMSADLGGDETSIHEYPLPYTSVAWMLAERPDRLGHFFGNPRRHWQHYASRMSGPRSEIRMWRAWACWSIATAVLPVEEFPSDEKQIREEGLALPRLDEIHLALTEKGLPGEAELWRSAIQDRG